MPHIGTVAPRGYEMEYVRFGQGRDALVILPGLSVQGVAVFASAVEEAYRPLASDFTMYVIDRRKNVPARYSMQEMARDTEAALDELGLGHANVFGASQGGMLALLIASERPDLVGKLVLGSTSAQVTDEQFQLIGKWIALAREGRAADLNRAFGEAIYPHDVFEQLREALAKAAESITADDLNRFVVLAESLKGFDVSDDLGKINCPVLVIGDRQDRVLGAGPSIQIAEHLGHLPGFELYLYDGFGHAAYDTAPDYKERIARFLLGS